MKSNERRPQDVEQRDSKTAKKKEKKTGGDCAGRIVGPISRDEEERHREGSKLASQKSECAC